MSKWISVDDRLPEEMDEEVSVDVLVFSNHNCKQAFIEYSTSDWYDVLGESVEGVTNWMPLPQPPEQ